MGFSDILILGKEHRRDPERATRELAARAAAASALYRTRAGQLTRILALEAAMPGIPSGSSLVQSLLLELGVPRDHIYTELTTYSTRAEARRARALAAGPMVVLTHEYHLDRATRIFKESGPARVSVHTPESFWRIANDRERAWMAAGLPTPEATRGEVRQEQIFGLLAGILRPLPRIVRENAEIWAGWRLRGSGFQQGGQGG